MGYVAIGKEQAEGHALWQEGNTSGVKLFTAFGVFGVLADGSGLFQAGVAGSGFVTIVGLLIYLFIFLTKIRKPLHWIFGLYICRLLALNAWIIYLNNGRNLGSVLIDILIIKGIGVIIFGGILCLYAFFSKAYRLNYKYQIKQL